MYACLSATESAVSNLLQGEPVRGLPDDARASWERLRKRWRAADMSDRELLLRGAELLVNRPWASGEFKTFYATLEKRLPARPFSATEEEEGDQ